MLKRIILLGVTIVLFFISQGCATTQAIPKSGVEYKYFEDYDAYIPVIYNSDDEIIEVRTDWLYSNDSNYNPLPKTKEEARQIVEIKETQIRKVRMKERLQTLYTFPLTGLAYLTFPISLPILFYYLEQKPNDIFRAKEKNFIETKAGVKLNLSVSDEDGNPIQDAQIIKIVSPKDEITFIDSITGLRSFKKNNYTQYYLSKKKIQLLTSCFPVRLDATSWILGKTNSNGHLNILLDDYNRFSTYNKSREFDWIKETYNLEFNFIAWAPGYKPNFVSAKADPLDSIIVDLVLKSDSDFHRIRKVHLELESLKSNFVNVSDFGKFMATHKINDKIFWDTTSKLEDWIEDETLPEYFRFNCLNTYEWAKTKIVSHLGRKSKYSKYLIEKFESYNQHKRSLSKYYTDDKLNPWKLDDDIRNLLYNSKKGSANDLYNLYVKGRKIDANNPVLEDILFRVRLKENNLEEALKHTKYIDHNTFIETKYKNCKLIGPK